MSPLPLVCGMLLLLLAHCSGATGSSPARGSSTMSQSQLTPEVTECPSCALARLSAEDRGKPDVVEAVKTHILNMLHLQDRPNITRPIPRAALLNAIRKLHVGRVAEDGSVQIEDEGRGRSDAEDMAETTEIITFAEAEEQFNALNPPPFHERCCSAPPSNTLMTCWSFREYTMNPQVCISRVLHDVIQSSVVVVAGRPGKRFAQKGQ
ncbi:hypothetical protein DPEC_G00073020 [Dallia pectoralis]|uniref:Uncharacterized protein n=1 Tax=Dallia pectoralis TaxID=75939 RepID=A0ACC2H2T8_DALPE|nr:hypothetical protein DPEC_G00073020 [Dallia pectoralis]